MVQHIFQTKTDMNPLNIIKHGNMASDFRTWFRYDWWFHTFPIRGRFLSLGQPCLRRCLTRSWRSKSRSNKRRCSCSSGAWRALVFGDSQGLCWLGKWSPGKHIFLNSCFLFHNLERHKNAWIWRTYDIIWLTCSTVSYCKDSCIRNGFQSFTIDKAGSAFQFRADDCSIQCA